MNINKFYIEKKIVIRKNNLKVILFYNINIKNFNFIF